MPNLILGDSERNLTVSQEFDNDLLTVSVFHSNFGVERAICLSKSEVHKLIFHLISIMEKKTVSNEY